MTISSLKKRLKSHLIIVMVLITSFCWAIDKPTKIKSYSAIEVWEGLGTQDDHSIWSIRLTIAGELYFIDYPSLNCGGKLIPMSSTNNSFKFVEKLSYGKKLCLDNGHINLIKNDNISAKFLYKHPEGIASGTLIKKY